MLSCKPNCHLHFWQNDWDLLICATVETGGGTDTKTKTKSQQSSSSVLLYIHRDLKDYKGWGAQDGHLDFHTAPEL